MAFNLLIVDDSVSIRQIIKRVISISGFVTCDIYEAENGLAAIKVLAGKQVDLILSDIHMPQMDGITLLEKVKKNKSLCHIPVVMVTTEAREQLVNKVMELGASGYITKPFHPEEIKQLLQRILGVEDAGDDKTEFEEGDF
jgi:two-component system chemotaxis response regulator CheY